MNHWLSTNGLKAAGIVLVLGAILPIPYFAYFQIMNWVVAGAFVQSAAQAHAKNNVWLTALFALGAVLFNPIEPIYLSDTVWLIADILAAFALSYAIYVSRTK